MDLLAQARALYAAERLREASSVLSDLLRKQPNNADGMQLLALVQFHLGFQREGLKLAERAALLAPENAESWNNLGLMRHLLGLNREALEAFERSTTAAPGFAVSWKNRGFVLHTVGRFEEALACFGKAGNSDEVQVFAGNSLAALNRHLEAIEAFDRAIKSNRDNGHAWHNRANSLMALGRPVEAVEALKQALRVMGQNPDAHCNLARALFLAGRTDEALGVINQVLKWSPDLKLAHELKGQIEAGIEAQAKEAERLASLSEDNPAVVQAKMDLATSLHSQGRWRQAIDSLRDAQSPSLRIIEALIMPAIFESTEMADEALEHLTSRLDDLLSDPPTIEDPLREVGLTAFHLPYFGISERPIQEKIAQLHTRSSSMLSFEAEHSKVGDRPRIGIACAYLTDHTISRCFGGLIERLDRERFELTYLQIGQGDDTSARLASKMDRHLNLENDLAAAQRQIADENLDVLFYPEISMDPLTYYLAFSRLAPVQCTTWGHPMTTGSPAIDHFISSAHLEREDGQVEYSEKLTTLPSLNIFYQRPEPPTPWTKRDFGLPENRRLYGCLQMPFKFHPDYDRVLSSIIEQDDEGMIVLVEPQRPYFKEVILNRWRKAHPLLLDRVVWLHLMPLERYLRLQQLCDVLLAPLQFGGGRSTLDAFGVGAPVVTYKGPYLKSRITYAAYSQIGMTDLIAETEEDYIRLALRLGKDSDFQAEMRRKLSDRSGPLFESKAAVRELNEFFASIAPGAN